MNLSALHAVVRSMSRDGAHAELDAAYASLSAAEQQAVRAWHLRRPSDESPLEMAAGVMEWMAIPVFLPKTA